LCATLAGVLMLRGESGSTLLPYNIERERGERAVFSEVSQCSFLGGISEPDC